MKKVFLRYWNNPTTQLLFRYGIVGVLASVVHFSIALFSYKVLQINFFVSHFSGFLFGLFTAYFGHYFYSFNDNQKHQKRFPKFVITSLTALVLHQGGAYTLVNWVKLDYSSRVLPMLVVIVPVFTFLLNKFWVFSPIDEEMWNW